MPFLSTKTYGHDVGISCAFRQWRANSHCRYVHGYALAFTFLFAAKCLDDKNWVIDFGGLKALKSDLEDIFDHSFVVAHDDPQIEYFRNGQDLGVLRLIETQAVGCEKFAELAYQVGEQWLINNKQDDRVRLVSVEVKEHGANSAIYVGDTEDEN